MNNRRTYWIEKKEEPKIRTMWYVWYSDHPMVATLFDVCDSESKAEQAIADHKAGKHATQFRPD